MPKKTAVTRRSFIRSAATVAAASAAAPNLLARDYSSGGAPVRYPDPDVVALDPSFNKFKLGNAAIKRIHTGMHWAEGPAWNGWGRYLIWSDIPAD
ncbi:MAG: SMP-30/gluconolactonase/LRE family protein, partial [Verrucomicrobiota bacterium]